MKEKLRLIPALLALAAALIASVVTMLGRYSSLEAMLIILAAILVFYIVGLIVKYILTKNFIIEEEAEVDEEADGNQDEGESGNDNSENAEGEVTGENQNAEN